jgi:hypothetical protein
MMTICRHRLFAVPVAVLLATLLCGSSFAQAPGAAPAPSEPAPDTIPALRGRPDAPQGQDLLGAMYENPTAGISFRTPGAFEQQKGASGDEIVRFVDVQRKWHLVASKSSTAVPLKLSGAEVTNQRTRAGASTQPAGSQQAGLLQVMIARLKSNNPGIQIARQDVITLGQYPAGIIIARMSVGSQRQLFQEAIIQANDQLYYVLSMTSPAAARSELDAADDNENLALAAFKQITDSVSVLDRSMVKEDQDQRLFRTRAFLVSLTPNRMRSVLIPEQWMRVLHEGKDIGYTYTVEEPDNSAGPDGIRIGVRSRSYPDSNTQIDGETWYYVSGDRKHENWSNEIWVQDLSKHTADQTTELGSSDATMKRVLIPGAPEGVPGDKQQPPVRQFEVISLDVQTIGKQTSAPPLKQDLPPWYLPQALSHILPTLLPIREPKTYLFAVYVSDTREVMHRYVDVGTDQVVNFNGKQIQAVPITDRITLEGPPTIHYMDPDTGKYLGSFNKQSKFTILPSTAAELQKIWENKADLTRPRAQPNPRAHISGAESPAAPVRSGAQKLPQ